MAIKLQIRGVIVPSDYDTPWALPYIERGLITPESTFRRELDAVTGDDVDIHINSPGGSVYAAWEMAIALREWREATGKSATVTIGAIAASAASAFAVMTAGRFRMHTNSKLMFHGASNEVWGGTQAHKDSADILGKINADIMTRLTTQYDLAPEAVAEWFEEGRMGWLSADEAQAAGMVSELIDTMDPAIEFDAAAVQDMGGRGLQVAALLTDASGWEQMVDHVNKIERDPTGADGIDPENANAEPPEDTDDGRDNPDADDAADPPPGADVPDGADSGDGDSPAGDGDGIGSPADSDTPTDVAYQEGHHAGLIDARAEFPAALAAAEKAVAASFDDDRKALYDLLAERDATIETVTTELDEAAAALVRMTGERDETGALLDQAREDVSTITGKYTALTGGLLAPPVDDITPAGWESAMAHAQDVEGMGYNDALEHCTKQFPELHRAYIKKHNPNRK